MISVGQKAVINIPDKIMPIRGLPPGKTTLRFRAGRCGEACTSNGGIITRSQLMDRDDHWFAVPVRKIMRMPQPEWEEDRTVVRYCENCRRDELLRYKWFMRDGAKIELYHCEVCGNGVDKALADLAWEKRKDKARAGM